MRRVLVALVLFGACQRTPDPAARTSSPPPPVPTGPSAEAMASEVAIARGGCARCHVATGELATRLAVEPGPALDEAVRWRAADAGAEFLQRHHGGEAAADLAAWVASLGSAATVPVAVDISPVLLARGEKLYHELACGACHSDAAMDGLAARTDHGRLAAFLRDPSAHRPGRVHLAVAPNEADQLAAWLLRAQQSVATSAPGFAFACFEQQITAAALPDLAGLAPSAQGVVDHIGADVGTREHHFVLRFDASLDVPAAGEWTFTTGSDDSSWLWIDDQLVVQNEALAPHRRAHGAVTLTAGLHALRVMYTQADGERSLEALWQGPGVEQQVIPVARATATRVHLTPPTPLAAPADAAVLRGREAAQQRRCDACHAIADSAFHALPPSAKPFAALGSADCPFEPGAPALLLGARESLAVTPDAETAQGATMLLDVAMLRDGCLSCHVRNGRGGMPPAVQKELAVVEDIGDEGRLPPDLTAVGRRLRQPWIVKVLSEGHSVRPYLRVRMPRLPLPKVEQYAHLFAVADARPAAANGGVGSGVGSGHVAPEYSVELAQLGRQLVGAGGRNCITCHTCQGHRSLGIQGMDLSLQQERLQPEWLRDWLLEPTVLRPNTRMPRLWWRGDEADQHEIDAIVTWLSLGATAPLPSGLPAAAGLLLEPVERVILHSAFLKGLSARCLAVGTPERVHYAFDLTKARLAWIWRGAFLDAAGTWEGRAGQLLEPKGQDWIVLDDFAIAGDEPRRMLGRGIATDGHPILRVAVGDAVYEDELRPRLRPGGSDLIRTLRCTKGRLEFTFPKQAGVEKLDAGGAAIDKLVLTAGNAVEVQYRW